MCPWPNWSPAWRDALLPVETDDQSPKLEIQLKATMARDPKASVVLKGDPAVNYARVVEVLDLTGAMGIGSVGLVTSKIGN